MDKLALLFVCFLLINFSISSLGIGSYNKKGVFKMKWNLHWTMSQDLFGDLKANDIYSFRQRLYIKVIINNN